MENCPPPNKMNFSTNGQLLLHFWTIRLFRSDELSARWRPCISINKTRISAIPTLVGWARPQGFKTCLFMPEDMKTKHQRSRCDTITTAHLFLWQLITFSPFFKSILHIFVCKWKATGPIPGPSEGRRGGCSWIFWLNRRHSQQITPSICCSVLHLQMQKRCELYPSQHVNRLHWVLSNT